MSATPASLAAIVEALLFAADEPLNLKRLAELTSAEEDAVRAAIDELNSAYVQTGRTFRINRVAQGFQLYTLPDYADWVRRLYQHTHVIRLSRAALEVLAVVAYRQPITRPEIDKLRGVDCSGPLITLLERGLITTAGRAHRPGNPFLYRTTREFLRYFGLESLDDLPKPEEISSFLAAREETEQAEESDQPAQPD
ncbi:MAG: SMC-Scp complex subunit ScpB [candidate division WOR-3 bacterium]